MDEIVVICLYIIPKHKSMDVIVVICLYIHS